MTKRKGRSLFLWLGRPKRRQKQSSILKSPSAGPAVSTPCRKRLRSPRKTPTPRSRKKVFRSLEYDTGTPNSRPRFSPKSPWFDETEEEITEEHKDFIDICCDSEVIDELARCHLLSYFTMFFNLVKTKAYPLTNIALLLWLETVRWFSCKVLTEMWYWDSTKTYWRAGYRLFHGKFLSFMAGPKSVGVNSENRELKLKPEMTDINFAVPSRTTVLTSSSKVPSLLQPGVIHETINALSSGAVSNIHMLCLDGKKVTAGLDKDFGDINMFGFEGTPTLRERQERRDKELEVIADLKMDIVSEGMDITVQNTLLQDVVRILSTRVREAREMQTRQRYGSDKLKERAGSDWKLSKYVFAISGIQAFLFRVGEFITNTLKRIDSICYIGSICNRCQTYRQTDEIRASDQTNLFVLRPVKEQIQPVPTNLVKQRSEIWFEIRKTTPVTGSTLHNALGLRSLKDQKQHYDVHVLNLPQPEFTEEVQKRLYYGSKHEIGAVATIVAKFLPMYKPDACFVEEGCYRLNDGSGKPFITVSPDGSIRHYSDTVSFQNSCLCAVEIKCPFPKEHGDHLYYDIPQYYICQCLAEMRALHVDELLFVCYTVESTTFFEMSFDENLWNELQICAEELYCGKDHSRPKRLSPRVQSLKKMISDFKSNHVKFVCELPSLVNVDCDHESNEGVSPYHQHIPRLQQPNSRNVNNMLAAALSEASECVLNGYQLSRRKANEVMVWVASNKDRHWSAELPNSIPIAYGLKDYRLSESVLRDACSVVLKDCQRKGLTIPLLAFDGQWYKLMVRDSKGNPLTLLKLQKDVWKETTSLRKPEVVDKIKNVNLVKLNLSGNLCEDNILIERNQTMLTVYSRSRGFRTICTNLESKHWKNQKETKNDQASTPETEADETMCDMLDWVPENVLKALEDSGENELLDTIKDITKDISSALNNESTRKPEPQRDTESSKSCLETDELVDSANDSSVDNSRTVTVDCLQQILQELCKLKRPGKWNQYSLDMMASCFEKAENMNVFTAIELDAIADILNRECGVQIKKHAYKKSWNKSQKINCLSDLVGDGSKVTSKAKRVRNPASLKVVAEKMLRSRHVPKVILNIDHAQYVFEDKLKKWQEQSPVGQSQVLRCECERKTTWYSHPERNSDTKQLLCKCLDSHHLLTNFRVKTSTSGIKNISPNAWKKVAMSHKTNLTPSMVEDLVDKQSNSYARTHFSEEVEEQMRENNDIQEANFCRLIRRWYEAEDSPALSVVERINRWLDLKDYLLKDVDFSVFPPPTQFIKGLSLTAFEGFITGIDVKIQLYSLCGPYCVRTASSLPAESVVGGIQDLNVNNTPSVKANDIPRIMSILTEIMTYKCNPDRGFHMQTSRSAVYPTFIGDSDGADIIMGASSDTSNNISPNSDWPTVSFLTPRDHFFDNLERRRTKARRKLGIITTDLDAPPKGTQPLRREFHKCDESKILPTRRAGISIENK